jgi:phospholipase C
MRWHLAVVLCLIWVSVPARADDRHHPRFPIKHVIFLVKENRTFDNYFGKFPGADGATSGRISDGTVIPLAPLPPGPQGASHSWDSALLAYHQGAMNQFDLLPSTRKVRSKRSILVSISPPWETSCPKRT